MGDEKLKRKKLHRRWERERERETYVSSGSTLCCWKFYCTGSTGQPGPSWRRWKGDRWWPSCPSPWHLSPFPSSLCPFPARAEAPRVRSHQTSHRHDGLDPNSAPADPFSRRWVSDATLKAAASLQHGEGNAAQMTWAPKIIASRCGICFPFELSFSMNSCNAPGGIKTECLAFPGSLMTGERNIMLKKSLLRGIW